MKDIPFVPAADLKRQFGCLGFFYRMQIPDGNVIRCRNVLEIAGQSLLHDPELHLRPPDACAVMMNPGSSRPLFSQDDGPVVEARYPDLVGHMSLVPTRPDNTQYQIMRIMQVTGWTHVRVLNLSDIREPKSPLLFQSMRQLHGILSEPVHSIFSDARLAEYHALFGDRRSPVIAGWGRHPDLEPLARLFFARIPDVRLLGVAVPGSPLRYGHPSPHVHQQKLAWLQTVLEQLNCRT